MRDYQRNLTGPLITVCSPGGAPGSGALPTPGSTTHVPHPRSEVASRRGLSYGGHTVGFTPPATLSRAAISHYNPPALHVHGGSSHAVARPSPRRSTSPDKFKRPTPPPSPNTHSGALQAQPQLPPPAQPMVQSMSSPAAMSQHASSSSSSSSAMQQQPPSQP
ncbi:hypothetical protein CRUP_024646 [Coryphaenoides rupestris]|nr:hypothetical protein CRUP_024646 [Coryphaenoides rupestris]